MASRVSTALLIVTAVSSITQTGFAVAAPPTAAPIIVGGRPRLAAPAENCPDPPPLGTERVVLYGTYEGAALSTAAVGDRDQEVNLADVVVEHGDEPLYLILSSADAVIWRFSGDVNRISKLYVSTAQKVASEIPAAGVVGVKKEKITFGYCLRRFYSMESVAGARARGEVRELLGREPTDVGASYKTAVVSFPSMAQVPSPASQRDVPPGFDKDLWRDVLSFWPSGLAYVDPKSVVSPEKAVAYDVLPSQGGLAQLVGSGALRRLEESREFKIVRPIPRFPAGMGGSHSAKFLLGKGVPYPEGDPVHSCVVSEETGEILSKVPHLCGP